MPSLTRQALLLMICAVCIVSCTVYPREPVGTGTFSYVTGRLAWTYPVDLQTAWSATLRALDKLTIHIQDKAIDGLGGMIQAQRADQTKVSIKLEPVSTRAARISIKIGDMGNREQSEKIHQEIRQELDL